MRLSIWAVGLLISVSFGADKPALSPNAALDELQSGNARYVSGKCSHPHQDPGRRAELIKEQHPPVVILSCSDSRVPPEVIFDQGLGDVFVVRVAGNIVTDEVLGSIEYAAEHLGSSLVMVLGHDGCGAVTAALNGGETHGHVADLLKAIRPAVNSVKGRPGDRLDLAVRANVRHVVAQLKTSRPVISDLTAKGRIKVVGAIYHLDTGAVEMLP